MRTSGAGRTRIVWVLAVPATSSEIEEARATIVFRVVQDVVRYWQEPEGRETVKQPADIGASISNVLPVTAPAAYSNLVRMTSGKHEICIDYYQTTPGVSPGPGLPIPALVAHVARISLPVTMANDYRRVLDAQISKIEARMASLPDGVNATKKVAPTRATKLAGAAKRSKK